MARGDQHLFPWQNPQFPQIPILYSFIFLILTLSYSSRSHLYPSPPRCVNTIIAYKTVAFSLRQRVEHQPGTSIWFMLLLLVIICFKSFKYCYIQVTLGSKGFYGHVTHDYLLGLLQMHRFGISTTNKI